MCLFLVSVRVALTEGELYDTVIHATRAHISLQEYRRLTTGLVCPSREHLGDLRIMRYASTYL